MSIETFRRVAGKVATVTAAKAATLTLLGDDGKPAGSPVAISAGAALAVGPFAADKAYAIDSEASATVAFTTPDPVSDSDTLVSPVLTTPDINGGTADGLTSFSLANDLLFLSTAGVPVDYTDGSPAATGEGTAGIGSLCIDRTAGKFYVNGGTKAQPVWKLVTSAA